MTQDEVVSWLKTFPEGVDFTSRDVADGLGLPSTAKVSQMLTQLAKYGFVEFTGRYDCSLGVGGCRARVWRIPVSDQRGE